MTFVVHRFILVAKAEFLSVWSKIKGVVDSVVNQLYNSHFLKFSSVISWKVKQGTNLIFDLSNTHLEMKILKVKAKYTISF